MWNVKSQRGIIGGIRRYDGAYPDQAAMHTVDPHPRRQGWPPPLQSIRSPGGKNLLGSLDNRLVDELAVHLNHTDAIFVCFFEHSNDLPSQLDHGSTRAEDPVDDLDLVGMNAQFSSKAQLLGPQGVYFQRLHIFEVLHVWEGVHNIRSRCKPSTLVRSLEIGGEQLLSRRELEAWLDFLYEALWFNPVVA
jgi:hypothetical protein